jgi:hypothetical protein
LNKNLEFNQNIKRRRIFMKKVFLALFVILLSACTLGAATTPKQKVSEFLDKYKNENSDIIEDLVNTIKNDIKVADHQERYKTLMTKQYKNMKYEIKDEIIEDNNAVVEAEITVYDYGSAIKKANEYLNSHPDEFKKEDKTTAKEEDTVTTNEKSDETDNITATDYDEDKFMEYKISEMEKVTDTVKYTIEFTLTKVNGEWQLDQLSNSDIEKLHGIYTS